MSEHQTTFVVCIRNGGCDDLEVRKIYEVLPDEAAAVDNYLRIIDDSGEDYLYPAEFFARVELSSEIRDTLHRAA